MEGPAGDSEQESVEEEPAEEERAEGGFAVEGPAGDSEQESVDDGSEGSPSLWMLARRTGMRLIRWMGS